MVAEVMLEGTLEKNKQIQNVDQLIKHLEYLSKKKQDHQTLGRLSDQACFHLVCFHMSSMREWPCTSLP